MRVRVRVRVRVVIQGFGAEARRGDAADTSSDSQMRQTLRLY